MGVDTSHIIISNVSNRCSCMAFKMPVFSKTTFQKNKHHTILNYNPTMPQFQYLINYKELIFWKTENQKISNLNIKKFLFFQFQKIKNKAYDHNTKKQIAS